MFRFRFYLKNAVLTKLYRFRQIIRHFTDKTDIYWIDRPLRLLSIHKCIIDNWKLGIERKHGKSQRLRVWKRGDVASDTWSNHSIVHSLKKDVIPWSNTLDIKKDDRVDRELRDFEDFWFRRIHFTVKMRINWLNRF